MAGWVETDKQTASLATATRAAAVGRQHIVKTVHAYVAAIDEHLLVQLKDDTTVKWEGFAVAGKLEANLGDGIPMTIGNAVNCTLVGHSSAIGVVNITGVTF